MHGRTQRHEKPFSAVHGRCDVAHAANEDQLADSLFGRGVGAGQWRISSGRPDRFAQPLHREFDILRLDLAPALDLPREPIGNLAPLCARLRNL